MKKPINNGIKLMFERWRTREVEHYRAIRGDMVNLSEEDKQHYIQDYFASLALKPIPNYEGYFNK